MNELVKVRLDRWLWAARFFKTRAQAKTAIEGGKVHMEPSSAGARPAAGRQRPKVSKEITLGDVLEITRGRTTQVVEVTGLSEQRGNATAAARETERARRRMENAGLRVPQRKPDKRERRELAKLKHGGPEEP